VSLCNKYDSNSIAYQNQYHEYQDKLATEDQ